MWLVRFLSAPHGEPRWAIRREEGAGYEVIRRRSARSFTELCAKLMKPGGVEHLKLKRSTVTLRGAVQVPTEATKVICVGLNYRRHAEEMGRAVPEQPLLFMKPTTALLPDGARIELPESSALVHHEGELAVVIGARLKGASVSEARAGVLGYACANDVTARDIQQAESRYTRAKGFDTFCPLGPALRLASRWEPGAGELRCEVNREVRQRSGLDDMIFGVGEVISFISSVMTLHPGDVVLTGTPSGVDELRDGDEVSVEIEGVGRLTNTVSRER